MENDFNEDNYLYDLFDNDEIPEILQNKIIY